MATPSDQNGRTSQSPVSRFQQWRAQLPQDRESQVRRHRFAALGAVGAVGLAVAGGVSAVNSVIHSNDRAQNPNVRDIDPVDNDPSNADDAAQDVTALRQFDAQLVKLDVDGSGKDENAVWVQVTQGGLQQVSSNVGPQVRDAIVANVVDSKDGRYGLAGVMMKQNSSMLAGEDAKSPSNSMQVPLQLPLRSGPAEATVFLLDRETGKKIRESVDLQVSDSKPLMALVEGRNDQAFKVTAQQQLADNATVVRVQGDANMTDISLRINNTPVKAQLIEQQQGSAIFRIQNGATLDLNTSFTISARTPDQSLAPSGIVKSAEFQLERSLTPQTSVPSASINSMGQLNGSTSPTNIPRFTDGGFGI